MGLLFRRFTRPSVFFELLLTRFDRIVSAWDRHCKRALVSRWVKSTVIYACAVTIIHTQQKYYNNIILEFSSEYKNVNHDYITVTSLPSSKPARPERMYQLASVS